MVQLAQHCLHSFTMRTSQCIPAPSHWQLAQHTSLPRQKVHSWQCTQCAHVGNTAERALAVQWTRESQEACPEPAPLVSHTHFVSVWESSPHQNTTTTVSIRRFLVHGLLGDTNSPTSLWQLTIVPQDHLQRGSLQNHSLASVAKASADSSKSTVWTLSLQ